MRDQTSGRDRCEAFRSWPGRVLALAHVAAIQSNRKRTESKSIPLVDDCRKHGVSFVRNDTIPGALRRRRRKSDRDTRMSELIHDRMDHATATAGALTRWQAAGLHLSISVAIAVTVLAAMLMI